MLYTCVIKTHQLIPEHFPSSSREPLCGGTCQASAKNCPLVLHIEDDLPKDKKKILRSRWLLGTKRTMQGAIRRRKARIIVGGHRQLKGLKARISGKMTQRAFGCSNHP
ncbi:uncharacterized protein VP01_3265g1 [Puccinia sorghi]|uniref:Uncharacterized protein n=1 Tax=Puccinia sorghi TaxID=27349 RepID=A0A0L6UZU3_9BASI|nr:uncharacterized protein VP01_3265g1 [Puccinia sorghi]